MNFCINDKLLKKLSSLKLTIIKFLNLKKKLAVIINKRIDTHRYQYNLQNETRKKLAKGLEFLFQFSCFCPKTKKKSLSK